MRKITNSDAILAALSPVYASILRLELKEELDKLRAAERQEKYEVSKLFKDGQGIEQYQERLRRIERRYAIVMARRSGNPIPSWVWNNLHSNHLYNVQCHYNKEQQ